MYDMMRKKHIIRSYYSFKIVVYLSYHKYHTLLKL